MNKEFSPLRGLRQPQPLHAPDYSRPQDVNLRLKSPIDLIAGHSPFDETLESYKKIFSSPSSRKKLEMSGLGYPELEVQRGEKLIRERFGLKPEQESNSVVVMSGNGSAGILRQSLELLPEPPDISYLVAFGPCFPYMINTVLTRRDQRGIVTLETAEAGMTDNMASKKVNRLSEEWERLGHISGVQPDVITETADILGINLGTINPILGSAVEKGMEDGMRMRESSSFKGPIMYYLCNPGTPIGNIALKESVKKFAEFCAERGDVLFIDEAYGDWDDDANSAISLTEELPNLIVSRTFSKAFKLGGWRIGYAAMSKQVGDIYKETYNFDPYSVSGPQQNIINSVLEPKVLTPYLEQLREKTQRIKERMARELRNIEDVVVYRSSPKIPYLTVGLTHGEFETSFYSGLAQYGIQAAPGTGFQITDDEMGASLVRMMIPKREQLIPEIIRRVKAAV